MPTGFGEQFGLVRKRNSAALTAFGVDSDRYASGFECIHDGSGPTVFTIGYERRDIEELIARLRDAGVETLVDVRERPFSRKADFRSSRLREGCERAGIAYLHDSTLGSTSEQRDTLKATGNIDEFMRRYRRHVSRQEVDQAVAELCELAEEECVALLCYERCHNECHRSVLADALHERIDANVIALT